MNYKEEVLRLVALVDEAARYGQQQHLRAKKAEADLAACRDLLAEAVGWIGDPSAYYGTSQPDDFDARVDAELAKRSTSDLPAKKEPSTP